MNIAALTASLPPPDKDALKRSGAAKDFEAILIGQMLKSMREGTGGWLGSGEADADETAVSLGEESLARAMSASGGLGFAAAIEKKIG